jgi:hypothetical protein
MLLFMIDIVEEMLIGKMTEFSKKYDNPLEGLKYILNFQFRFIEENKGIPRILFSEALQFEDINLTTKTTGILTQYLTLVKKMLSKAKKQGLIKSTINVDTLAHIFMGMIQSTVILWTLGGCKISLKKKEQSLWKGFKLLIK